MSDKVIRGGPVRARDLRIDIATYGFENGVTVTLERLLDEFAVMRGQMRDMTQLLDHCVELTTSFIRVSSTMKDQLEKIKQSRDMTDRIDNDGA